MQLVKKLLVQVAKRKFFFLKNCASNFFGALAKEWQLKRKTTFTII